MRTARKSMRLVHANRFVFFMTLLVLVARTASGQEIPTQVIAQNRTGDLPFSTSIGNDIEHVDVASGSVVLNIPIAGTKGRGMDYHFGLNYNALFWVGAPRVDSQGNTYHVWKLEKRNQTLTQLGWELDTPYTTHVVQGFPCQIRGIINFLMNYIYEDSSGGKHPFIAQTTFGGNCSTPDPLGPDTGQQGMLANLTSNNLYLADGSFISAVTAPGGLPWTNPNGNSQSDTTDTLGRSGYTKTTGTNQIIYSVNDSAGTPRSYTLNLGTITIQTTWGSGAFGSYRDFPASSASVISSIVLPNGQSYQFQYEPSSYGGLTRVDFPTGAYVTYTWATADSLEKKYRYVASRTLHVDGQTYTWNFTRTSGDEGATETVVDPLSQTSVFQISYGAVTQAQIYSGAATGTPMRSYWIEYVHDGDPFNDLCQLGIGDPHIDPWVGNRPIRITTTLDNNLVSKKEFDYETFTYTYHRADMVVMAGMWRPLSLLVAGMFLKFANTIGAAAHLGRCFAG